MLKVAGVTARAQILITAAELAHLIETDSAPTILDVRWRLDEPDGHAAYLHGHLPGAVYVSLEDELSDRTVTGRGRHPLPSGRRIEQAARRWGVHRDAPVVVYDDWNRIGSSRAWWVLRAAGLMNVRILDGGLAAWRSARGRMEPGQVGVRHGNVTVPHRDLYAGGLPVLTAEQAGAADVTLFDARAPERFRGDVEPVDPVAGHIPNAKNLPSTAVLADDETFLADSELAQVFSEYDIEHAGRLGVYCGSGVSATVIVAALATLGYPAALFPGSWSEWISDPARAIARSSA
ncbi:putative thiosulfate sulfurtransferase SseB [Mycobacterium heckeshornense]|nr:putative thiosulfate sulfurtransferase SseB [Mycobacterium heckeshornense]